MLQGILSFLAERHPEALFRAIWFLSLWRDGPPVHRLLKVPICIMVQDLLTDDTTECLWHSSTLVQLAVHGQALRQACLHWSRNREGSRDLYREKACLCWRCPASAP